MNTLQKFTLLLILLTSSWAVSAQVAVKAGVNFANMLFEEDGTTVEDLTKNGSIKFVAGLAFILPLTDVIALQPELLFQQKGAERKYTVLGQEFTNDITYNYIDIPLLLRLSLGDTYGEGLGLYLNAGVYGAYALSGKSKNSSVLGDSETEFTFDGADDQTRLDYGLAGGVGVTIGNLFFDLRYTHGINNLLDDDANNNNDSGFKKYQHRGLALTGGIAF
jgi:hypothetical protein